LEKAVSKQEGETMRVKTVQWCKAVEETVTITVEGKVSGNMVNGVIVECKRHGCPAEKTPYCWLHRHVLTSIT